MSIDDMLSILQYKISYERVERICFRLYACDGISWDIIETPCIKPLWSWQKQSDVIDHYHYYQIDDMHLMESFFVLSIYLLRIKNGKTDKEHWF